MKLIDTHCHLYSNEFAQDIADVIKRAMDAGVQRLYLPAIDSGSLQSMLKLEQDFPGKCFAMAGLHPCSVKENYQDELLLVENVLQKRAFVAIGEIGLDFYWDKSFEEQQYQAFNKQIELALHYNLPIVIHSRESMQQTIDTVKAHQAGKLKGIFHCFSGTLADAKEIIDLGFYLGIGGVLTYKKSNLPEILPEIGLENIVLETDSPYLSPMPYRGKRNESSYLVNIAKKLAEVKNTSVEEVAAITTANALRIFHV